MPSDNAIRYTSASDANVDDTTQHGKSPEVIYVDVLQKEIIMENGRHKKEIEQLKDEKKVGLSFYFFQRFIAAKQIKSITYI